MNDMATIEVGTQVARPLKVLVPLIREDLTHGNEAAKNAAMPYFKSAGEKMIEAKPQLGHGEFEPWIKRNFGISASHARNYMALARATANKQNAAPAAPQFSSLDDFRRKHLGQDYRVPGSRRDVAWTDPVKQIIGRVDTDTLNLRKAEMNRAEEREAQRKLALQLIDIGYKALASKLHPDKGGSRDAMARLNAVRDRLKAHV